MHQLILDPSRITPPCRCLNCPVSEQPSCTGVGVGVVVLVCHPLGLLDGEKQDLSCCQCFRAGSFVDRHGSQAVVAGQCLSQLSCRRVNLQHVGWSITECDSQPQCKEDREDEYPEDCLRLSDDQEESDDGQLIE